jgi:hypothetical protein
MRQSGQTQINHRTNSLGFDAVCLPKALLPEMTEPRRYSTLCGKMIAAIQLSESLYEFATVSCQMQRHSPSDDSTVTHR